MALASAMGCAALAVHHPLLGAWALLVCAAAALAGFGAPGAWPVWLLPLLPVVGGMPWTGWLLVEELDLLVLSAATGGYARWATRPTAASAPAQTTAAAGGWLLLALYGAALLISMLRGVADAGGLQWGWWQGYHEPMNALRLAKSLFWCLLLLPLWLAAHRHDPSRATRHMLVGWAVLLAVVALTVLCERLAHTGLSNFSSDYRASGLFWEMHVGGAALDAALALSLPFAAARFVQARSQRDWMLAAGVLMLAGYACLVTFSRVVYVATPVSLLVLLALRARQQQTPGTQISPRHWFASAALIATYATAATAVFPVGGYRGLLALLGVFALALPLGASATSPRRGPLAAGLLAAAAMALLCGWAARYLAKGAYIGYVGVALVGAACVLILVYRRHVRQPPPAGASTLLLACTLALCAACYWVIAGWGGAAATRVAATVAAALAAGVMALALWARSPWPESARWQLTQLAMLVVVGLVIGVFAGGSYMGGRWAALQDDLRTRIDHARGAIGLLQGPLDGAFGRGMGRYAASQILTGNPSDQTGDYRWLDDGQAPRLLLTSGKHTLGWGELFRISQRIDPPGGNALVKVRVRTAQPLLLHAEVCEKHLLYNGACITGQAKVQGLAGAWQTVEWPLVGNAPTNGTSIAPRFIAISLAIDSAAGRAEFEAVELHSHDGRQLLANERFHAGMARWFFSSDHHHMPWHAKNVGVHLVFEQGLVGFALLSVLACTALWRLAVGRLREHPLAPAMAAAIVGVGIVGTADSLFDMPRIAFLIYLLLAAAVLLMPAASATMPVGQPKAR